MKNQWDEYQRELQHHYIIRVQTEKGPRYIFSYRAVVEYEGYAKYLIRRSAHGAV